MKLNKSSQIKEFKKNNLTGNFLTIGYVIEDFFFFNLDLKYCTIIR